MANTMVCVHSNGTYEIVERTMNDLHNVFEGLYTENSVLPNVQIVFEDEPEGTEEHNVYGTRLINKGSFYWGDVYVVGMENDELTNLTEEQIDTIINIISK